MPANGVLDLCEACTTGKMHRTPFPRSSGSRAKEVIELIHSDVCGPFSEPTFGGARYFVTFVDDKSRKVWVHTIAQKSEVFGLFKELKAMLENQTNKTIKTLRTDNGGEYTSNRFKQFLVSVGIKHQLSVAYNPQQNGVAERMNRTLKEMMRSLLGDSDLPNGYWGEAVRTAAYLRNRCPSRAIDGKSPEQVFSGKVPGLSHLKAFGSKAYVFVPDARRRELDPKANEWIFVGYSEETKAYRLVNQSTKEIKLSRDVKFDERKSSSGENRLATAQIC